MAVKWLWCQIETLEPLGKEDAAAAAADDERAGVEWVKRCLQ